jgi:hypothetical protein
MRPSKHQDGLTKVARKCASDSLRCPCVGPLPEAVLDCPEQVVYVLA